MSALDIDDTLGSLDELNRLILTHEDLALYLVRAYDLRPVRTFFIPFGAGISVDGRRVYISYDIQTSIDGVECENALVRHETTEFGLRQYCSIGLDYDTDPRGHRLANRAEYDRVEQLLGRDRGWPRYCEIIDPQVVLDERMSIGNKPIPKDLALYPYSDDEIIRLQGAMFNDRSVEEWEKMQ